MKSDSELVDDFIEGLASGAIESTLRENSERYTKEGYATIASCQAAIEAYRAAKDPLDKAMKANAALTQILQNRIIGVYVNNPLQERLGLLKAENDTLRTENEELKQQIAGYMDTVRKLQAEVAGRTGIG